MAITLTYYNTDTEQWFEIKINPDDEKVVVSDTGEKKIYASTALKCKPILTKDTKDPMNIMRKVFEALGIRLENEEIDGIEPFGSIH